MLHKQIKFSFKNKLLIYLNDVIGLKIPKLFWKNKEPILKLYQEGSSKIEKMLDLSKMIKNNRTFKILLKNTLLNKDVQNQIKHTSKNLINLEPDKFDLTSDSIGKSESNVKNEEQENVGENKNQSKFILELQNDILSNLKNKTAERFNNSLIKKKMDEQKEKL